jgi:WD40 repeat protein
MALSKRAREEGESHFRVAAWPPPREIWAHVASFLRDRASWLAFRSCCRLFRLAAGRRALIVYNDFFVSGARDNTLRLWNADGSVRQVLSDHTAPVRSVVVWNGKLARGSDDKTIRVWEEELLPRAVSSLLPPL